jgi:hypothetical protein
VPPGGVAEGVKDGVQLRCLVFNHAVEYDNESSESQPAG